MTGDFETCPVGTMALLESLEWSGNCRDFDEEQCPCCGALLRGGRHVADCKLAAILTAHRQRMGQEPGGIAEYIETIPTAKGFADPKTVIDAVERSMMGLPPKPEPDYTNETEIEYPANSIFAKRVVPGQMFVRTEEKRMPKEGDWFLENGEAHRACFDFQSAKAFHILRPKPQEAG
jgi:hypothetical protein